ncbi:hypothetical protein C2138_09750 [Salinibacterium hongtaonis]|nr:hypothetical protein C2138_09750 [Salinibacterium hongtaonis]
MVEAMPRQSLSLPEARRLALGAQALASTPQSSGVVAEPAAGSAPRAGASSRRLRGLIDRIGLVQLDSVNVFERSHYLPLYSRLGAYDKKILDRITFTGGGTHIEYWAHEAAIIPVESWPLMRWRMERLRAKDLSSPHGWARSNPQMLEWLLAEIAEKGPLPASQIEHDANKRTGPWWGWSDVKHGLEYLFRWGDLVSGGRSRFERVYALPGQVLPPAIQHADIPEAEAQRRLVAQAARALGVGTASDFADYFRMRSADTVAAIRTLEDEGVLVPTLVEGWQRASRPLAAWMHRDAVVPRRATATALLSPFDPLVWDRKRTERLFGFHYRIEIYTPAPQRIFGYYSLPLLIDDRLVGRVDLKSDRQAGVLRVQSAWAEPGAPAGTVERLAPLLRRTAQWQGLGGIEVVKRGTLADALAGELGVSPI